MILNFKQFLNEDAYANAASVTGMGAVVTSQPSAIPGDVSGATTGSGDIGFPFAMYTKMPQFGYGNKEPKIKNSKKDKKDTKSKSKLANLYSFDDFLIQD